MGPETFLKACIAVVGLQCAGLGVTAGWLLLHPPTLTSSDDASGLAGPSGSAGGPGGRSGGRKGRGGPGGGGGGGGGGSGGGSRGGQSGDGVPRFQTEIEALADYVHRLDTSCGVDLLFEGTISSEDLQAMRAEARKCTTFECAGVLRYQEFLAVNGRRIPPEPQWGSTTGETPAHRLVTDYVNIITGEMWSLSESRKMPTLKPDPEKVRLALACRTLECDGVDAFVEYASVALAAVGRTVPSKPSADSILQGGSPSSAPKEGRRRRREGAGPAGGPESTDAGLEGQPPTLPRQEPAPGAAP